MIIIFIVFKHVCSPNPLTNRFEFRFIEIRKALVLRVSYYLLSKFANFCATLVLGQFEYSDSWWIISDDSRPISLMYYWPNFKARFYQKRHVITQILTSNFEARYTRYHHKQSLLKCPSVLVLFENFDFFRFFPISVMLNMPTFRKISYITYNMYQSTQSDPKLCFILVPNSSKL